MQRLDLRAELSGMASPVRLGHMPRWFYKRLLATFAPLDDPSMMGVDDVLAHAICLITANTRTLNSCFDHWGSIDDCGRSHFVTEPYDLDDESATLLISLASRMGLRLKFDALSHWNPPATIRVVFLQP